MQASGYYWCFAEGTWTAAEETFEELGEMFHALIPRCTKKGWENGNSENSGKWIG